MLSSISQGHAREAGREGERLHFAEGAPSHSGCAWDDFLDISCSQSLPLSSVLPLNFLVLLLLFSLWCSYEVGSYAGRILDSVVPTSLQMGIPCWLHLHQVMPG